MSKNITKWLVAGIGLALVGSALAQQQQASPATQAAGSAHAGSMQDGIVMRDGEVYFIKNGQPQRIDKETRLSEGITVDEDGNVTLKDGTKTKLTDNQMVTLDGQLKIAAPAMGQHGAFQSPSPGSRGQEAGR